MGQRPCGAVSLAVNLFGNGRLTASVAISRLHVICVIYYLNKGATRMSYTKSGRPSRSFRWIKNGRVRFAHQWSGYRIGAQSAPYKFIGLFY